MHALQGSKDFDRMFSRVWRVGALMAWWCVSVHTGVITPGHVQCVITLSSTVAARSAALRGLRRRIPNGPRHSSLKICGLRARPIHRAIVFF